MPYEPGVPDHRRHLRYHTPECMEQSPDKKSYFEKADNQQLTVPLENTITREFLHYKADIVVLSIGAEPATGIDDLGKILGIARDEKTGFFTISEEDDVSAVGQERIFIAGNASGPKDTQYSLAQASSAALKAAIIIGGIDK